MRSVTRSTIQMKRNSLFGFGLVIFLCGYGLMPVFGQAGGKRISILGLAEQYASALKRFQSQKNRSSLEALHRKGEAVAERLSESEELSEARYGRLKKLMKGYVINREEIVFIEPKARFFIELARSKGTEADVEFFRLKSAVDPDDVWPAYMEQQTDCCGCTIYGKGILTRLYRMATKFKRRYPSRYVNHVREISQDILATFTDKTCACGDRESVIREFKLFIKSFPNDKNLQAVKQRLLKFETWDFRFNCKAG